MVLSNEPPETEPFIKPCRFEHLALDYDEEDIGSLSEGEGTGVSAAPLDPFGTVLDDFLANAETGLPVEASEVLPACLTQVIRVVITGIPVMVSARQPAIIEQLRNRL